MELMVVVTIVGVLAAMAMPSYRLAIRQSRADIAAANLRAIWAAERLYWLEYHSYTDKLNKNTPSTIGVVSLVELGLLDSAMFPSNSTNYTYDGPTPSGGMITTFTATATSPDGDIILTIDDSGKITTLPDIKLGFQ
jgi:Tfp pilus assembly protein PilE